MGPEELNVSYVAAGAGDLRQLLTNVCSETAYIASLVVFLISSLHCRLDVKQSKGEVK